MQFVDYVKHSDRLLCAPLVGFPGRSATNSTVKENLCDSTLQAISLTALHSSADFDILFPMMDLTVEAEALGATVSWDIDELPCVTGTRVASVSDAESIRIPGIGENNRLNVFVDACGLLKKNFPNKPVWAYVLGPFSIAGRLMGMTEIAIATKIEPEVVHATLNRTIELLLRYTEALLDTGVDGLMILEPASGMLGLEAANEFSNEYIKRIVHLIKSRGKTPALHNCGNVKHLVEGLCATGIEALHVGSVTDMPGIYHRVPENVALMGNLDPTEVFLRGDRKRIEDSTLELIRAMAGCDRFIISSGCDIPPGTAMESVLAFEKATRDGVCGERERLDGCLAK